MTFTKPLKAVSLTFYLWISFSSLSILKLSVYYSVYCPSLNGLLTYLENASPITPCPFSLVRNYFLLLCAHLLHLHLSSLEDSRLFKDRPYVCVTGPSIATREEPSFNTPVLNSIDYPQSSPPFMASIRYSKQHKN